MAAALVAGGSVAPALISPPPAQAEPATFTYTGGEQTYSVPTGYSRVTITTIGGKGSVGTSGPAAGWGGSVTATVDLPAGATTLYVEVGGNASGGTGGWNGGGSASVVAGAGGGASDVRTESRTTPLATSDTRIVVAGGGGGAGKNSTTCPSLPGGSGGNAGVSGVAGAGNGGDGDYGTSCAPTRVYDGASGGFGSSAGNGGFYGGGTGSLGQGGNGAGVQGAGGGGGYYGGGGGGAGNYVGGGGGGGSSYWATGATNPSIGTDSTGVPSITITPVATAPSAPMGVVATKTGRGMVALSWTDDGVGITAHTVDVYTYKKGSPKRAAVYTPAGSYTSGATSSWTNLEMLPGGVYVFRVTATNPTGDSPATESNAVRL